MSVNSWPSATSAAAPFPSLASVTAPTVPTAAAAFYLGRTPQTLREWACRQNGPLSPIRINGRLAWPTATLRHILRGAL